MTVIALINKENYSMIATDSRIMLLNPKDKLYEDRCSKLFFSGFGWVAGIGYGPFISNFENKLTRTQISNLSDIGSVWFEAYQDTKKNQYNDRLNTTGIAISYHEKGNPISSLPISVFDPQSGHYYVKKNGFVSFLPDDSIELNIVKEKYRPLIENSHNIEELIYETACYFKEVSDLNNSVSKICDCGFIVQADNNLIEFMNIREPIETIKYGYKRGNLNEHMKMVSSKNI